MNVIIVTQIILTMIEQLTNIEHHNLIFQITDFNLSP